jgi:hypothetical protein
MTVTVTNMQVRQRLTQAKAALSSAQPTNRDLEVKLGRPTCPVL